MTSPTESLDALVDGMAGPPVVVDSMVANGRLGAHRSRARSWALLVAALVPGCAGPDTVDLDFDFARGPRGFVGGFADYPPSNAAIYGLEADYRTLPEPLDTTRSALYIAGTNRSDDLFMYYKGEVRLEPGTAYRASFEVEFATEAPSGCGGVGGSPGENVYVKAGVSLVEPRAVLDDQGILRMDVDKGQQGSGGRNASVLGNVGNSRTCEEPVQWELKSLSGGPLPIQTSQTGRVWLFFGSDSGFEGRTALYYTRLRVRFDPS
jgi:hypothetical protein